MPTSPLHLDGHQIKPPGGYFAFSRNPYLRAIVQSFITEYDNKSDTYNVPSFDEPVVDRSPTPVYDMHMYWAKKPHGAIRKYINHFTKEGDVVLDPMCGSGGTGSVAVSLGRKAILIDLSPAATFISKHAVTLMDTEALCQVYEELYNRIHDEIQWLYETRCDRCGGIALTMFVVHSQVYRCLKCFSNVAIFDCYDGKNCPHCHEEISTRQERLGYIPVETSYVCLNGCSPSRDRRKHNDHENRKKEYFEKYDLKKIQEIESKEIPYWYPTDLFPRDWISWRPNLGEARNVSGFFTKRNLWAASLIVDTLQRATDEECKSWLMFTFTATLLNISKKAQHLEEGGGYIPGNYTFPPVIKERNALNSYQSVSRKVIRGTQYMENYYKTQDVVISTQSALDLSNIPPSSIDYIFTDPPYSNKVPFGEFNFLWEVWLRKGLSWLDEEIIVNEKLEKTYETWKKMMVRFIEECYRILKPGRWMSVCYHDSAEGSWGLLQEVFEEVGFITDKLGKVLSIERDLKSFKQRTTKNVQMRDLVMNFRKPRPDEIRSYLDLTISGLENEKGFREKVLAIVRGHLERHPGSSRDRIYDEVVSHMFRLGQMEPHNFDELLTMVAEPGGDDRTHWFLKVNEETQLDSAESTKEDTAAKSVEGFITNWMKEHLEKEGVHYSDIFEHYISAVKEKPRRQLQDWLLDYFYRTPEGTYRLPANEEEVEAKARSRTAGTNRRIKRYLGYLQENAAVPFNERLNDATLAEWIRHCKRGGLYAQGKLLYEKGGLNLDNLSEEVMVGVEEDYQVCARMLARGFGAGTSKQKKRGR